MNNLHISVVVLMIVQSPTMWNEEHPHDLSLQQPTCAQVCTDNAKTKLTLELNDLPLILELAVHANDLEFTEMLIVTPDVMMSGLANQETENILALFGGPLLFLEYAVIHTDHLQGQPGNMWEISAACQMVMAIMKWWHKHFSPWKSNLVCYCCEKMSLWNINVFDPRDGMQQHFKIKFFALIPLLGSKVNKKFQDRLEQVGGQMLLYQFVGAKTEVLTIPIYKCTKLCLVLLGHEILETLISITSVMEKLRLTFPWDPGGHSSSYVHI